MTSIGTRAVDAVIAIREKWHTKNHPFYVEFAEGKVPLLALGKLMAQHYAHTSRAVGAFGMGYFRSPPEVRHVFLENLAEEEGEVAGPGDGRVALNHLDLIVAFCEKAGLSRDEVMRTEQLPSWRARTYKYINTVRLEPIGVVLAMQSTQEGQQPAINRERTLPGLTKHHGFKMGSPEIGFFSEHEVADADHSDRQIDLVRKLINSEELYQRALVVAEDAVRIRWDGMNEIYRTAVLGEADPLPPALAAE